MVRTTPLLALAALSFFPVHGIDLDVNSVDSIKSAASSIAGGMVAYYNGNNPGGVIGVLPSPYYWWEAGAMFDTLIQYWHLTGDSQYNSIVTDGLVAQQGPDSNFMPPNYTNTEGNDDQAFWALAAMSAAEAKLPEPQNTSWVGLADAVFNDQVLRWDDASCDGGLRWQIFPYLTGYNYKTTISNGAFFQLASRLARYTGNSTYSDWAAKAYDWTKSIGFINDDWSVFDGAHVESECTDINKVQFSYVAGTFVTGLAHMYNITGGDAKWKSELDGLLNRTLEVFFPMGIAYEVACEPKLTCTTDMFAFKGLLGHWLLDTVQMAPYTSSSISPQLTSTAEAAAKACIDTGCPFKWNTSLEKGDKPGVGQQMSALSFVQGLLGKQAAAPVTLKTGGSNGTGTGTETGTATGNGNTSSTTSGTGSSPTKNAGVVVGLDKEGMGILIGLLGSMSWLLL